MKKGEIRMIDLYLKSKPKSLRKIKFIHKKDQQRILLNDTRWICFVPVITLLILFICVGSLSEKLYHQSLHMEYMFFASFCVFWPVWSFCRGLGMFVVTMLIQMLILIMGLHHEFSSHLIYFGYVILPSLLACKDAVIGLGRLFRFL